MRLGQEGRCVVDIAIGADGRIDAATLRTGTGFEVLDAACLNAVRGQRMVPATADGTPVPSHATIPIVWKLTDR